MGIRVYISSTLKDLRAERDAVADALPKPDCEVDRCENDGSQDAKLQTYCEERVEKCQIYVLIVGWRYGFVPEGSVKSITECEYDRAVARGKVVLVYCSDDATEPRGAELAAADPDQVAKAKEFRGRLQSERTPRAFLNLQHLRELVLRDLIRRSGDRLAEPVLGQDWWDMCDRSTHAEVARLRLRGPVKGSARIVFVFGADGEGHSFFLNRLLKDHLKPKQPKRCTVTWLGGVPDLDDFVEDMHTALACSALDYREGSDEPVPTKADLARLTTNLYVTVDVRADRWSDATAANLRAYVESWFRDPLDKLRADVVVALAIRRTPDDVAGHLTQIETLPAHKGRVFKIPPLRSVGADDIRPWVEEVGLNKRFGIPSAFAPLRRVFEQQPEWRMEELLNRMETFYRAFQQ